jgi:hypothetical protein
MHRPIAVTVAEVAQRLHRLVWEGEAEISVLLLVVVHFWAAPQSGPDSSPENQNVRVFWM